MSIVRRPPGGNSQDINSTHERGRHGTIGDAHKKGEFGTVIACHSDKYTMKVRTERGRILESVPRMRAGLGDVSQLPPGTEVLVSYDYGPPIIMGAIVSPASSDTTAIPYSTTAVEGLGGQGANRDQLHTSSVQRQAHEPTDLMPGDMGWVGRDGNTIAVLEGGTNVIKSSPLAQIRTYGLNDLVEIFSRNFRHVTDMGEFTVLNNDGKINMRFRGASDQMSEAGPDEENWTIHFDLGSEGDLFNLEFTTPQGNTLFKLHVDAEGGAEIFAVNGITTASGTSNGGGSVEEHTGNKTVRVAGSQVCETSGDESKKIEGAKVTTVSGGYTVNAGSDVSHIAGRDVVTAAARNMEIVATGGEGDNALTLVAIGGNLATYVGGGTSLDSAYRLQTEAGDIELKSQQGGAIRLVTEQGSMLSKSKKAVISTSGNDSVVLGGDSLVSHVVKYEQLRQHLVQLYNALDTHRHLHTGTALAASMYPVVGLGGPPAQPIGAPLISSMVNFKSNIVGVSG